MDLTELTSRVRGVLRDATGTFVVDGDITDWANEAQLDLTARLSLLHGSATGTMGGAGTSVANGTIDLPTDFVNAKSLRLSTTDDAEFADDETFWSHQDAGTSPANTLFRVFNEKIEMYPKPATATAYALRYIKKPTALSAGGDTSAIPEELHVKLVRYAQAHAFYKQGKFEAGDRYLAIYETGLPSLPLTRRQLPGPTAIAPAPDYFDTSDYLDA